LWVFVGILGRGTAVRSAAGKLEFDHRIKA
jgi:hypothetical protein